MIFAILWVTIKGGFQMSEIMYANQANITANEFEVVFVFRQQLPSAPTDQLTVTSVDIVNSKTVVMPRIIAKKLLTALTDVLARSIDDEQEA